MNWNRAKNIILLMLFLTNLFLACFLGYMNITQQHMFREAAESTVRVLKSHGIELDIRLISNEEDDRRLCVIERDRAAEQVIAQKLMKNSEVSDSGGNDHYVGENGSVTWMSGGFVEGSIASDPASVLSAFSSANAGKLSPDTSSEEVTSYMQELNGLPVFNCIISLTASENGTDFTGRYCTGTPIPVNDSRPMSETGILIKYSSGISGQVVSRITDIDRGWAVQTLPGIGIRLIPIYRITADTATTYMNAIDGSVLLSE